MGLRILSGIGANCRLLSLQLK